MTYPYSAQNRTIGAEFCQIELSIFQGLGTVTEPGGAIHADSIVYLCVQHCLFERDIAEMGGGIYTSSCGIRLYSSCFSNCRGSRVDYSDGGNAASFASSTFSSGLVSADHCAPQRDPCGDGVFSFRFSKISVINMNCSRCLGKDGECCIGESGGSSVIKYLNSAICSQYCLIAIGSGKIMKSNFINNQLDGCFAYTFGPMTFEDCAFFGNNDHPDRIPVTYLNCIGDISRTGITPSFITQTHQITQVEFSKCLFRFCDQMSRNIGRMPIRVTICSLFWM